MTRTATLALPVAFAAAGGLLLATAAVTGAPTALGGAALLAVLLLARVADPPVDGGDPRLRAWARGGAAALAFALAAATAVAAIDAGIGLDPRWRWIAGAAAGAGALLLLPVLALPRIGLEGPVLRSERTALVRGAAICGALAAALLLAGTVLPALAAAAALCCAAAGALEAVALARPGGAGLRRVARPEEADAVAAAVATGPPEVIGHRRVVIRASGGAEHLSAEVLLRRDPDPARAAEIRSQLERAIKGALPELVVSVRLRVGELPAPGPDDPTRQAEPTATLVFDELADERPTEAIDAGAAADRAAHGAVLPSAPWREG